jgi:integrase
MLISDKTVRSLAAPAVGKVVHYDDELAGFGVRVTARGIKSFLLNYRTRAGRERRYTLGRFPEWSAVAAREEAETLRYEISKGADPMDQREKERGEPTLEDLSERYMTEYAEKEKRPSSLRNDRQMLANIILPKLGKLKLSAITSRDINALHGSLRETPYRANRVLALLSKMFSLASEWQWLDSNPVRGVKRYDEDQKEVWLSIGQLRRLELALSEYPDQQAADAIRLLIVTGAREGEVLAATWDQFDLKRGVWTKPSHHTKQKKIEHVPLNRAAIGILRDMSKESVYLFPGKAGARVTVRRPWVQVCRASGLAIAEKIAGKRGKLLSVWKPTVRIHDLRHTFASHLVSAGASLHQVGKLLGHTNPATTARYAHVDNAALKKTTDTFGNVYRRLQPSSER